MHRPLQGPTHRQALSAGRRKRRRTHEHHEQPGPHDDSVEALARREERREGPEDEHDEERAKDGLADPELVGAELLGSHRGKVRQALSVLNMAQNFSERRSQGKCGKGRCVRSLRGGKAVGIGGWSRALPLHFYHMPRARPKGQWGGGPSRSPSSHFERAPACARCGRPTFAPSRVSPLCGLAHWRKPEGGILLMHPRTSRLFKPSFPECSSACEQEADVLPLSPATQTRTT
eukprot:365467-Chlamydomonas_euryale.AAC.11